MRKSIWVTFVLVFGIAIGMFVQRHISGIHPVGDAVAQKNAIKLLGQPPAKSSVADTELIRASAKIEPAVVNLDVVGKRRSGGMNQYGGPSTYMLEGKGSGVIISADGYIVTNYHVVEGASIISVTTQNGCKHEGRTIGADPDADLAVVKIDGVNLPYAVMGDSSVLKVGQEVIAIGYPLGIGTTVTHGIVSATDRKYLPTGEGRMLAQAIQTDAPINRGNSGGALANTEGQLIGINTAIASENGGGNIGIGFAIPINSARAILKDIITKGQTVKNQPLVSRPQPFIGLRYELIPPGAITNPKVASGGCVVVDQVVPLTPADSAGLRRGDIIVAMDGKPIRALADITNCIKSHGVGGKIVFRMLRGDRSLENVTVTVGQKPAGWDD